VHLAALLALQLTPAPANEPDERPVELTLLDERPERDAATREAALADAGEGPDPRLPQDTVEPRLDAPEPTEQNAKPDEVLPPSPPPPEQEPDALEFARSRGPDVEVAPDDARYFSDRATAQEREGRAPSAAGASGAREAAPRQAGGAAAPTTGATAPLESAPLPPPGAEEGVAQEVPETPSTQLQERQLVEAETPSRQRAEAARRGEVAVGPAPDADWLPLAARVSAASQAEVAEARAEQPQEPEDGAEGEKAREGEAQALPVDEPVPPELNVQVADRAERQPPPPERVRPDALTREGPVDQAPRDDDGLADAADADADAQAEPGEPGTDSAGSIAAPSGVSGVLQVLPDDVPIDLQAIAATRDHPLGPWAAEVDGILESGLHYPAELRAQRLQGRVVVVFTVQRNGRVIEERVLNTSGHSELDTIARFAVPRVLPAPRPFKGRTLRVRYTFRFNVEPSGAGNVESP